MAGTEPTIRASKDRVDTFLASYETRRPYFGLFTATGTDTEEFDRPDGASPTAEGIGSVGGTKQDIQVLLDKTKKELNIVGQFINIFTTINDAISSITVTNKIGGVSDMDLTVSYSASELVRATGGKGLMGRSVPYAFLDSSRSLKDYYVLIAGYLNLGEDETALRAVSASVKTESKALDVAARDSNGNLIEEADQPRVTVTRRVIEDLDDDGRGLLLIGNRAVQFIGYLSKPSVQGDENGVIVMTYNLKTADGLGKFDTIATVNPRRPLAIINDSLGIETPSRDPDAPSSSDEATSTEVVEYESSFTPLSGTINLGQYIAACLNNVGAVDTEAVFKTDDDGEDGAGTFLDNSKRIKFTVKDLALYFFELERGIIKVPVRAGGPAAGENFYIYNLMIAQKTRINPADYRRIYDGYSRTESVRAYLDRMLKPFGFGIWYRTSGSLPGYVIGRLGSNAGNNGSDIDAEQEANFELEGYATGLATGEYGFETKTKGDNKIIPLFEYGLEVLDFDYKLPLGVRVVDNTMSVNLSVGGEFFEFQIDRAAIQRYYDANGGPSPVEMFRMAQEDPDAFIVMFTKIAGEVIANNRTSNPAGGASGITMDLTLKHAIPGLRPGFLFAFRGARDGILPSYIEGVYVATEVVDEYSASDNLWVQTIKAAKK